MATTLQPLALVVLLGLVGCPAERDPEARPAEVSTTAPGQDPSSVGPIADAPELSQAAAGVSCTDVTGDTPPSPRGLDLLGVSVTTTGENPQIVFRYVGTLPTTGTVALYMTSDSAGKQYGWKVVDGKTVRHFIYDMATDQHDEIVNASASATGDEATIGFPRGTFDGVDLSAAMAGVDVNRDQVDWCELS